MIVVFVILCTRDKDFVIPQKSRLEIANQSMYEPREALSWFFQPQRNAKLPYLPNGDIMGFGIILQRVSDLVVHRY